VTGFVCADLGCNVGGFTDCLLQRGAAKVFAVDTGYGALAWKLRKDSRVVVMERTNVLHLAPPQTGIDLAVIDLGWTTQRFAIPAALRWSPAQIIALIKPHYEASDDTASGILDDQRSAAVLEQTLARMPDFGVRVVGHTVSPIRGGGGRGKRANREYLALLQPVPDQRPG
jgi:23S rRNA (cytidine1920-2'-O)/16S rRNA (cytidine1409-2'-O)-methyltransferase